MSPFSHPTSQSQLHNSKNGLYFTIIIITIIIVAFIDPFTKRILYVDSALL